jgi:peptidoglycan/xylan/chitin deacetylase (PgdA/CDA1 family)
MTQLWQQILPISGKGEDIMKYRKWMTVGAALAFLFTAQPAYAAPVIVAGSGSLAVESTQTVGEQQASEAVTQAPGAGQTETTAAVSQSPTIVSGQGQSAPGSTGSENSAPVSAGEVTGIPEGPGGIKSEPVTPVTPEELAAQEAAQAAAQQSTGQSQTTDGIDPSKPMVALTFDDGPQPSVGNRIMDCLAQYGGKATFFMVGERVGSYKTEVQRMVAEGHEVANHTMNHKYLQKLGAAQIQAQVNNGNDAIQAACGVRPTLLRLPGGNHNAAVLANAGMPMIQWNVDTLDWKTRNADKTVAAVLNHVKDGDIILMHELYGATGDAVARIVPELHKRGFQMVTVSQMAAAKGRSLEAGKLYSSFH